MNKTNTLSIIFLNYRSLELINTCIDTLIKYPPSTPYEIIVVDNDSQDGKFDAFTKTHKDINCISNTGNFGYSSGCNLGAKYAIGNHLLFVNPDVEFTASPAINAMIDYANTHQDAGLVSCRKIKPGNKIEREQTFINPWLTLGIVRTLYKKIKQQFSEKDDIWHPEWLTGSIFLIPTKVFKQVSGLSEQDYWMYFEEMDIANKVTNINKTITLIRNVEICHQHGGSSRINPTTAAITKSEVMISRHVYIQKWTTGINCISLHISMLFIGLTSKFLIAIISLPFFWTKKAQVSVLLLVKSVQYYLQVPFRRTWKSKRLKID